ncbi:MAG: UV DNA damage repair endonuclease UvsE [Desulfobulbaceae bacterium]|nr:UV DNA damage repair endonuclease UvsE [Desulfobulbaceae bacterium]
MLRLGLCCLFRAQPIKFRQTTAKALRAMPRDEQLRRLSSLCLHNVAAVREALHFLAGHGIGAYRIPSPLFPRATHPEIGYTIADLPESRRIRRICTEIRAFRKKNDIRLSLHPDQFNVLSSPREEVVANTIRELEYQGDLAELLDAEVINLHAGGSYGDKEQALRRLEKNFHRLSAKVRGRLTLENDDSSFTPSDLLPVCRRLSLPFIYDVHHHRCLPDDLGTEQATDLCMAHWHALGREPYFHLSSPKNGWQNGSPKPHADYIDPADFPACWRDVHATIDVEAKAKELAVLRLREDLGL